MVDIVTLLRGVEPTIQEPLFGGQMCEMAAAEIERLRRDEKRLEWLGRRMAGASDSERYLPFRVYWGDTRDIRRAIDSAMGEA